MAILLRSPGKVFRKVSCVALATTTLRLTSCASTPADHHGIASEPYGTARWPAEDR